MSDIQTVHAADAASLAPFDAVIDVRSPAEFAEDHVPGAISLPVLSDSERAQVGTIYVQESRFRARRIGAALIARNVARHLETALADKGGDFKPLVYCWRGGQRSRAMATILAEVGWRTAVLAGGYKTYRRRVKARLYDEPLPATFVLLDGRTGSGKTEMLARLASRGVQTLDLEALAEHRGSVFGGLPGRAQPSQKMFESRLLGALESLDLSRPVVAEAEASKVGDRMVPPSLWEAMQAAPRIALSAPLEARASYLARVYADVVSDRARFDAAIARLPVHPGRKALAAWRDLADAGDLEALARELMQLHYDPAYDRAARKEPRARLALIELPDLTDAAQEAAAGEAAAAVAAWGAACAEACEC
ncbi:MAG TPA: tRNA 2-selenouridine(34) synthase MnmH [Caulobacteraceae bacterium]|nr:tRNA 2-selenouridine(34) synthase MnmH [Caulobacteraceae bacterium]